ncbi:hypothetical protein HPP92_009294 [Vanilla planifolia]|uniref:Retrotransposon gag domain-containing protein n=1 Tax=Vanilla planifolia TaxID=51239 RepID=A0A835V666_VANPL|nr:hypothetical protein HPP92_009294 [Vanilla planifolia]
MYLLLAMKKESKALIMLKGTDPLVAERWIKQMTRIFEGMDCPEHRRVPLAILVLDDEAVDWWESRHRIKFRSRPTKEISWPEFVADFEMCYIPLSARERMREDLSVLVQGALTVSEYERKFSTLGVDICPDMFGSEEQRCFVFRKGLKHEIKSALISFRTADFFELVKNARMIEQNLQVLEVQKSAERKREEPLAIRETTS